MTDFGSSGAGGSSSSSGPNPNSRRNQYKKGLDADDARRQRVDEELVLRKAEKANLLAKKHQYTQQQHDDKQGDASGASASSSSSATGAAGAGLFGGSGVGAAADTQS